MWADTIVSALPVGGSVTVYYDPKNPSQCVLTRKNARAIGAIIPLVGLGFSAIGLAVLDYVVRSLRAW